jgi:hypothetical protein
MPIIVERLEAGIYQSIWTEYVNLEAMLTAAVRRRELASADNAETYVSIIDVSQLGSIPFDLDALRKAVESDPRVVAFLVVGVSLQARILVESLIKTTSVKIEFASSTEDALKRARTLLDEG